MASSYTPSPLAEKNYQELLEKHQNELKQRQWIKNQSLCIAKVIQDAEHIADLAENSLRLITPIVEGCCAIFYLLEQWSEDEEPFLRQIASYASPHQDNTFHLSEGFVGQCARDESPFHLKQLPSTYLNLKSGTGTAPANALFLMPILHENTLKGILEIASFQQFTQEHIDLIHEITPSIAGKINSIESRNMVNELLLQSHKATQDMKKRNQELLDVKQALEQKNTQIQETSRYKSEFLANMSHELRTPLNSLLLLSDKLSKNTHNNLNPQEVEYASVISNSGQDLLTLINDILDLSKIEAGKMTITPYPIALDSISKNMERLFKEVAKKKKIKFKVNFNKTDLPDIIQTDFVRVGQILRNFLSNAFKFTHKGSISLSISLLKNTDILKNPTLRETGAIVLAVTDTGIGIPQEKLDLVFESFQQADGSTSRQYGGTGLGLSISKELAKLLDAEIHIKSTPGEGSTFTLYIPNISGELQAQDDPTLSIISTPTRQKKPKKRFQLQEPVCPDDREKITSQTPFVLLIADDHSLASDLTNYIRAQGELVLATHAPQDALHLATHYSPKGILLDLGLKNLTGKSLQIKLNALKIKDKMTFFTFSTPNDTIDLLRNSCVNILPPPFSKEDLKNTLKNFQRLREKPFTEVNIISDDVNLIEIFKNEHLKTIPFTAHKTNTNKTTKAKNSFLVLDAQSSCCTLSDPLRNLQQPLLLLTQDDLSPPEKELIRQFQNSFLNTLPEAKRFLEEIVDQFIESFSSENHLSLSTPLTLGDFSDKTVLIVDDDMRNIFALSAALEDCGLNIIEATTPSNALDILGQNAHIDMLLINTMIPDLDGQDIIERVRRNTAQYHLPVIAMSAKAMKEDRASALDAGADEFISKPIEIDNLTSIMKLWFKKKQYAS